MTAAAAGILDIVTANMMGAVRVISVEQGEDPREFALVAFGGAGPLHAVEVARTLGMRHVLVPPRPGLLSAIGLLHADVRGDFSVTRLVRATPEHVQAINAGFAILKHRGDNWLASEQTGEWPVERKWRLDMRYLGQNSELGMAYDGGDIDADRLMHVTERFHQQHSKRPM